MGPRRFSSREVNNNRKKFLLLFHFSLLLLVPAQTNYYTITEERGHDIRYSFKVQTRHRPMRMSQYQ